MTASEKKKLMATNAGVWAISILASLILPFIADSLAVGSAKFIQLICFAFPLILGMAMSTLVINKAITEPAP